MFSGLLFLIIGCAGAYLGLMKAQGRSLPVTGLPVTRLPVTRLPVTRLPVTRLPVTRLPVTGLPGNGLPVYSLDTVWEPRPGGSGGSTSRGYHGGARTTQQREGNSYE